MIRPTTLLGAAALALLCSSCASVVSSGSGQTSVNGEAWYVRTTSFMGLTFSARVFHCAPPKSRGPATCKEAKLHGAGSFVEAAADEGLDEAKSKAKKGDDEEADEEADEEKPKKKRKAKKDDEGAEETEGAEEE